MTSRWLERATLARPVSAPLTAQTDSVLRQLWVADPHAVLAGPAALSSYFNGVFGPDAEAIEVDVTGIGSARAAEVLTALAPRVRWRFDRLAESSVNLLQCGLRWRHDRPELVYAEESLVKDLADGRLRYHSAADEPLAAELLHLWPGIHADGHHAQPVVGELETAHIASKAGERGGRLRPRVYTIDERPWLAALDRWHQVAHRRPETVPAVPLSALPAGDPWQADDDGFRSWLIDHEVTRSGRPDDFLATAMAAQRSHAQKPTHQGWEVARHGFTACLMLDTAAVAPADRRALRVATLLHDIGKVKNVWTPGAHGKIGAALWQRHRPAWLTDREAELVSWLIAHHDLPGLMDRGIRNDDYRGGLCPRDVRDMVSTLDRPFEEAVTLAVTIYSADISAVPTLRWLRPLTPILRGLIEAGHGSEGPYLTRAELAGA
ncbi:HD domain-containing protein [Kribbella sp. NBC_01505]|uniref:HD domain-containing protein n=1 Tax=Kribbella sp. NBC_01505 TaxID=2903580 RepID=UPI003864E9A1